MAMDTKPGEKPESIDMGLEMPEGVKPGVDKGGEKKASKGVKTIVTVVIVVIVLIIVGFLINQYTSINLFGSNTTNLDVATSFNQDSYYAVFLSNGQVYFGKVSGTNSDFTVLQDIYYLQVSEPLQQVPPPGGQAQPQLSLVKLGNELHGPQDYMRLSNRHIIFVEELKTDGRVVEAIMNFKATQEAAE